MKGLITYKQAPKENLSRYIDAYWSVKNSTASDVKVPIVPDGCVDIVIKNGDIFLVGLMNFASIVSIKSGDFYLGIRFKPAVMGSVLNCDMSVYNDTLMPLEEIAPMLHDRLKNINTKSLPFAKLDEIFEALFCDVVLDERIMIATQTISAQGGQIDIEHLSATYQLSQKQLERLFVKHVGTTPKRFARFIRFIQTHKHLTKEGLDNLCIKVLEKGYYDQAHFNREYKSLTGLTPTSEAMSIFYNTKE